MNLALRILVGILATITLALAVLFIIPATRNFMVNGLSSQSLEYQTVVQEVENLNNQLSSTESTLATNQVQYNELLTNFANVNSILEEKEFLLNEMTSQLENNESYISDLTNQKTMLTSQCNNLSNQISALTIQKNNLLREIDDLSINCSQKDTEITELNDEIENYNNQLIVLDNMILEKNNLLSELQQSNTQLSNQISALISNNNDLNNNVQNLETSILELNNEINNYEVDIQNYEGIIAQLNEEILSLQLSLQTYIESESNYNFTFNDKKSIMLKTTNSNISLEVGSSWNGSYYKEMYSQQSVTQYRDIISVQFKYLGGDGAWHQNNIEPEFMPGNNFYYNRTDRGYNVTSVITFIDNNDNVLDVNRLNDTSSYKILDVQISNLTCYEKTNELIRAVGGLNYNGNILKSLNVTIKLGVN